MNIKRKADNLIITIPLKALRYNPYMGDDPIGERENIAGVIEGHHDEENDWDDCGFMYLQDMSYKGKDDQLTDWAIKYYGSKEDFEKLCKELSVPIWYT